MVGGLGGGGTTHGWSVLSKDLYCTPNGQLWTGFIIIIIFMAFLVIKVHHGNDLINQHWSCAIQYYRISSYCRRAEELRMPQATTAETPEPANSLSRLVGYTSFSMVQGWDWWHRCPRGTCCYQGLGKRGLLRCTQINASSGHLSGCNWLKHSKYSHGRCQHIANSCKSWHVNFDFWSHVSTWLLWLLNSRAQTQGHNFEPGHKKR